jgi:hypothetical protein
VSLEDLVLMPEVDARRALAGRPIAFSVLAPVGAYAGRGTLRVLRVRPNSFDGAQGDNGVELICGYEAYDRLP